MKYTRLSKEQLEALNFEFARFLAAQQIDIAEWEKLKQEKPQVAEDELDIFSEMVWEKSLSQVVFLDFFDKHQLYCIKVEKSGFRLVSVVVNDSKVDLTTNDGLEWLGKNIQNENVQLFQGNKKFSNERNQDIFELIMQGYQISKGTYFEILDSLLGGKM